MLTQDRVLLGRTITHLTFVSTCVGHTLSQLTVKLENGVVKIVDEWGGWGQTVAHESRVRVYSFTGLEVMKLF